MATVSSMTWLTRTPGICWSARSRAEAWRLEHDVVRRVRLAIRPGDAFRIGEVGGHDIQALALRLHGRTGDVENVE